MRLNLSFVIIYQLIFMASKQEVVYMYVQNNIFSYFM